MRALTTIDLIAFLSALGSGLIAGVFFAFSTSVMKALGTLPPPHGIAAMQSINVVILNPIFLTVFMGTAVTCLVAAVAAVMRWQDPGAGYLLAGSLLYLIGAFGVTMVFNVPRNDALNAVVPGSPEGAALWASYLSEWTAWNHVRGVAALASLATLTMALIRRV